MIAGMTLEDWFAGQIIAAMIGSDPAYSNNRDPNGRLCGIEPAKIENLTKNAYQVAAAMMQARPTVRPRRTTTSLDVDARTESRVESRVESRGESRVESRAELRSERSEPRAESRLEPRVPRERTP